MKLSTTTLALLISAIISGCSSTHYSKISSNQDPKNQIILRNNLEISPKNNIVAVRLPKVIKNNGQIGFKIYVFNGEEKEFLFSPRYVRIRFLDGSNIVMSKPLAYEELEARSINANSWKIAGMAYVTAYNNATAGQSVSHGTFHSNSSGTIYANNGKAYDYSLQSQGRYTVHTYDSIAAQNEIIANNASLQNFIENELSRIKGNIGNFDGPYLGTNGVRPGFTVGGSLFCDIPFSGENFEFQILVDAGGELHQFNYIVEPFRP